MISEETVNKIRVKYQSLQPEMDERGRRMWAAAETTSLGHGGAGNRRGVFAYKSGDIAPATVNCYWGGIDIWDGEIADFDGLDAAVKATFFNNVPVPNPAATSDDFIQGGAPVPPDIDSEGDFETAIELMASGEYGRAVRYFWSHLEDHSGVCDFNSLQRLLICVRRSGGDLRELRSSYLEYARDEQMPRQVSFEARRLAGMTLLMRYRLHD